MIWRRGHTSLSSSLYLAKRDRLAIRVVLRDSHVRVLCWGGGVRVGVLWLLLGDSVLGVGGVSLGGGVL